jgi:hypothetical protein
MNRQPESVVRIGNVRAKFWPDAVALSPALCEDIMSNPGLSDVVQPFALFRA